MLGFLAGGLQQFRAQLLGQKRIGVAVIHQQIGKSGAVLDQRHRIMLAPGLPVAAEIAAQRLDAPWHLRGSNDRRKGAGGAVAIGMAQRDGQRAVPAHGVTEDRLPLRSTGKCSATSSGSSSVT